jgi:hypothetical protein
MCAEEGPPSLATLRNLLGIISVTLPFFVGGQSDTAISFWWSGVRAAPSGRTSYTALLFDERAERINGTCVTNWPFRKYSKYFF